LDVQEEYGGYSILLLFTKFVLEWEKCTKAIVGKTKIVTLLKVN
jgi:hypothetical protein